MNGWEAVFNCKYVTPHFLLLLSQRLVSGSAFSMHTASVTCWSVGSVSFDCIHVNNLWPFTYILEPFFFPIDFLVVLTISFYLFYTLFHSSWLYPENCMGKLKSCTFLLSSQNKCIQFYLPLLDLLSICLSLNWLK